MFTVDGFFYNAWFSDGLSLKKVRQSTCLQKRKVSQPAWQVMGIFPLLFLCLMKLRQQMT